MPLRSRCTQLTPQVGRCRARSCDVIRCRPSSAVVGWCQPDANRSLFALPSPSVRRQRGRATGHAGELLRRSHAPEPQNRPLASSERQVRVLCAIVEQPSHFSVIAAAEVLECGTVGPEAVVTMLSGVPCRFIDFLRNFRAALRSRVVVTKLSRTSRSSCPSNRIHSRCELSTVRVLQQRPVESTDRPLPCRPMPCAQDCAESASQRATADR